MTHFKSFINSANDNTNYPALETRNGEDTAVNQYEPDLNKLRKNKLYLDVAERNLQFVEEAFAVEGQFDASKNPEKFRPYLRFVDSEKGQFFSFPSLKDFEYREAQYNKAKKTFSDTEQEIASAGCSTTIEPTPEIEIQRNKYTLQKNTVDSSNTIEQLVNQYSYWMQRKFKLNLQLTLMRDGVDKLEFTSQVKTKNGSQLWVFPKSSDVDYIDAKLADIESKIEEYLELQQIRNAGGEAPDENLPF